MMLGVAVRWTAVAAVAAVVAVAAVAAAAVVVTASSSGPSFLTAVADVVPCLSLTAVAFVA